MTLSYSADPNGRHVETRVFPSREKLRCEYILDDVGEHKLAVRIHGRLIDSGTLSVAGYDARRVRVLPVKHGDAGEPAQFVGERGRDMSGDFRAQNLSATKQKLKVWTRNKSHSLVFIARQCRRFSPLHLRSRIVFFFVRLLLLCNLQHRTRASRSLTRALACARALAHSLARLLASVMLASCSSIVVVAFFCCYRRECFSLECAFPLFI